MQVHQSSATSDCPQANFIYSNTLTIGGKSFVYCAKCFSYHEKPELQTDGKQLHHEMYTTNKLNAVSQEQSPLERNIEQHRKKLNILTHPSVSKHLLALGNYQKYQGQESRNIQYTGRDREPSKNPSSEHRFERSGHIRNPSLGSQRIHSLGKNLQKKGSMKELRGIQIMQQSARNTQQKKNEISSQLMDYPQNPEYYRSRKLQLQSANKRSAQKY